MFVEGENFLLKLDGKVTPHGFFTSRFVEADDEKGAKAEAVHFLRDEIALRAIHNDRSDPPIMFVREVVELESFEGVSPPGSGFTFYEEGGDESRD